MKTQKALLVSAVLGLTACGVSSPAEESDTEASPPEVAGAQGHFQPSSAAHIMPVREQAQASRLAPYATTAHLSYYGGKVIQNAKVVAVFWGSSVNSKITGGIGNFYSAVTNSTYFDWLSEYNTSSPAQHIGRGSYLGGFTITPGNTSSSLTDAQIQTEINNQINAGRLPAPDANTLYMTYFPPGVSISLGSINSCASGGFCAYHGTFNGTRGEVYYGVMPDMAPGSACNNVCGGDPTWFNNATSVSSHELIEAVTDAEVGLTQYVQWPLAWYDASNGEIGDICNASQGAAAGYVVQREWSNGINACRVAGNAANPIDSSDVFVRQMYRDNLEREADPGGYSYYLAPLQNCGGNQSCLDSTRVSIARSIFESPEHRQMHPELDPSSPNYKSAYINNCYTSFMRRQKGPGDGTFWLDYLNSTGDYDGVIRGFITSPEYRSRFL